MKSRIVPHNKVVCDDCSGEFDLKIREEEIESEIIEQFFRCPHCGARTTITITDPDKLEDAIANEEYPLIWEIYGKIYAARSGREN